MKKTVGIIFADAMEYNPFLDFAVKCGGKQERKRSGRSVSFTVADGDNELNIIAVECGIGKVNAAAATAFLICDDKADYILNAGLSGAISGVKREDIVVGMEYMECDFDLTAIGYDLAVKPDGEEYIHPADEMLLCVAQEIEGLHTGRLGTGDIFLSDSKKKQLFKKLFGITAFDMETAAIAAVCRKCGIPMLSVRKISDDAEDASGEDYREMNNRQEACLTEVLEKLLRGILKRM